MSTGKQNTSIILQGGDDVDVDDDVDDKIDSGEAWQSKRISVGYNIMIYIMTDTHTQQEKKKIFLDDAE
jgi:hypothetical protein